jgi:hypothetical protein
MCPTCRRHLVEIAVRMGQATLTMHACSTCDRSWWDRDGQPVDLGAVLSMASAGAADQHAEMAVAEVPDPH